MMRFDHMSYSEIFEWKCTAAFQAKKNILRIMTQIVYTSTANFFDPYIGASRSGTEVLAISILHDIVPGNHLSANC